MNTIIKVREIRISDIKEVFKHLSVQSILEMKSLYGRVELSDIADTMIASYKSYCVLSGAKPVCLVFFVREKDSLERFNMFLLFTSRASKCYNTVKEAILAEINLLNAGEIKSVVYEGCNISRNYLAGLGFEETGETIKSVEGKRHIIYRK